MSTQNTRLTELDLSRAVASKLDNSGDSSPVPLATEADHWGEDFKAPPPRRMWEEEREDPRLLHLYGWTFTAAIVASALLARCA